MTFLRAVRVLDPNKAKFLQDDKYIMFTNIILVNPFEMNLRDEFFKYLEYLNEFHADKKLDVVAFWIEKMKFLPLLGEIAIRALLIQCGSVMLKEVSASSSK
jgi:hypothetical protein